MTRYLSGLCVAGLGLCAGGWLVVAAAVAFRGGARVPGADQVNLATGGALMLVSVAALGCWSAAWRRRMRADGVLADRFGSVSRRQARRDRRQLSWNVRWTPVQAAEKDPAELLSQIQALLGPVLTGIEAPPVRRPPNGARPLNGTRPPERAMAAADGEETW